MKQKYVANSKRTFTFHFLWIIGFGFDHDFITINKDHTLENVAIYLPFCKININQYFRKEI